MFDKRSSFDMDAFSPFLDIDMDEEYDFLYDSEDDEVTSMHGDLRTGTSSLSSHNPTSHFRVFKNVIHSLALLRTFSCRLESRRYC